MCLHQHRRRRAETGHGMAPMPASATRIPASRGCFHHPLIVGLVLTAWATPARAYVVEITTSIELSSIADKDQLRHAVESAIVDVLTKAIAFPPTVVTLQNARVVGDRMYL